MKHQPNYHQGKQYGNEQKEANVLPLASSVLCKFQGLHDLQHLEGQQVAVVAAKQFCMTKYYLRSSRLVFGYCKWE